VEIAVSAGSFRPSDSRRFASASGVADWPRIACAYVARQRLDAQEDHGRDGEKQEEAQRDALDHQFQERDAPACRLRSASSQTWARPFISSPFGSSTQPPIGIADARRRSR
jgi:hypothetical protein